MSETATQPKLSSGAIAVLGQLFLKGPTWDGDLISKMGRTELVDEGLADRLNGWNFLTRAGVAAAVSWDTGGRYDRRWYRKQRNLPEAEPK